jgi:hypothetical protein
LISIPIIETEMSTVENQAIIWHLTLAKLVDALIQSVDQTNRSDAVLKLAASDRVLAALMRHCITAHPDQSSDWYLKSLITAVWSEFETTIQRHLETHMVQPDDLIRFQTTVSRFHEIAPVYQEIL